MNTAALERFGLNKNEISVYLTLLKEGLSTGGKIAEKAYMHRRTAYDTLNSLIEQGLVTFIIKERIKYFRAVEPKNFLDILREKEEEISTILPELEALQTYATEKADAEVFQGIKSVKKILEDVLNSKQYCVLGAGESLREMLGPFFLLFQKRKKEKKILSRVLVEEKYRKKDVSTKTYGKVRFLKKYEAPTTTYIYRNKVAIILSEPPLGIVIENEKVAKSFQNYFEQLWRIAKT